MSDQQSTGEGWSEGTPTDEAQQPEFPVNDGFDTYGEEYESAPSAAAEGDGTEDYAAAAEGGGTEDYAAASYPGERWDTAPAVEGIAEQAWDYAKEQANEAWEWATEGSESEERPFDGGGGGEGGPPSYDDGGGGGYGPSDAGVPGGVPDTAYCDHSGACPVCAQERQMSSGCVLALGHGGEHQCAYGDLFWQGVTDIPGPAARCDSICPQGDNETCQLDSIHTAAGIPHEHGGGGVSHQW